MNQRTPDPTPPDVDDELDRRLRSHLRSESARLPAPRGTAAAVTRARSRRRNRRAMFASAAVVAVAAASSFVLTTESAKEEVQTAAQRAVVDETLGFDWTVTDNGLAFIQSSSGGDSGFYALSTAPGTKMEDFPNGDAPRAMYRLTAEGTWAPIALEGDEPAVGPVSQRGGTLYALSTGSASSRHGRPTGSISTDGGESWSSVPLEAAAPPSTAVPWELHYQLDVESTAERTMAIVNASVSVPYDALFPELTGEGNDGSLTIETTDEGVSLLRVPVAYFEAQKRAQTEAPKSTVPPADGAGQQADPQAPVGEVVRTVTWAEMGITGPADLTTQTWAYVAEGADWVEVTRPAPSNPSTGQSAMLDATSDAFVLSVNEVTDDRSSGNFTYRSTDGQSWEPLQTPGTGQILTIGNALVQLGSSPDQMTTLQVSRDGVSWSPVDITDLDPSLADLTPNGWIQGNSGPLGIALLVSDKDGTLRTMLFSTDLERWSITKLDDVMPEGTSIGQVVVGTDRVVVSGHTDVGEPGSPTRSATMTGVPRQG